MKRIVFLTLIFSGFAFGQETTQTQSINPTDSIYEKVDKDAEFPGGLNAFRSTIMNFFDYSKVRGTGIFKLEMKFVVNEKGEIEDLKVEGNNKSVNKEFFRVVNAIKTKWIPANINGVSVKQRYKMPMKMSFE